MKKTKSMVYNPSTAARELYLYATNNSTVYNRRIAAIEKNLKKKLDRGVYDHEKAATAFYYAADEASRLYNIDFGYAFSVTDRYTAAVDMADDFLLENCTPEKAAQLHAVKIA